MTKTVAIILKSPNEKILQFRNHMAENILSVSNHVVLIFIERSRWFLFNDPHAMLESEKLLSLEQKTHRKTIVNYLEKVAKFVRRVNKDIEISKLVISGNEKYKIRKCLMYLDIDAVIFFTEPRKKRFFEFFVRSLEEYVFETMRIPVVRVPAVSWKY